MAAGDPIPLVLPAFPAKSANLEKVTGPLPDLGEELALRFSAGTLRCSGRDLSAWCAQLVICSDGRVFSDVVGVAGPGRDCNYRQALVEMIDRLGLKSLQMFDLDDVCPELDF